MTYEQGIAEGMRRAVDECKRLAESYTRSLSHYAEDDPQRGKIKWGAAAVTVAAENILAAIPQSGAWEPPADREKVAALVAAASKVFQSYWYSSDGVVSGMYELERALSAFSPLSPLPPAPALGNAT